MEEEARDILRNAVKAEGTPSAGLGTEISSLFTKAGLRSDLPELRGHEMKLREQGALIIFNGRMGS
jgi:plasmid stability protein